MNYIEDIVQAYSVLTTDDISQRKALPRAEPNKIPEIERPKSPWCFEKSIFAPYKFDTDELLVRCFNFDWNCSKIERMIKSVKDKERMYLYLNKNYR